MRKLKLDELGRLSQEEFKVEEKIPIVLCLDNIRSGLNVGSLFRSGDAYAIEKVILCGITAQPPHREILKTAIGATDTIPWDYHENILTAIEQYVDLGYDIIAIEQTDKSIPLQHFEVEQHRKYVIIMGNEVRGVSDIVLPLISNAIEIQQYGTKHSLNVAVCGGIVLHHFSTQYRKSL